MLTTLDKAAIYYYTDDGFEALNRKLHASSGANNTLLGQGLAAALAKLPAYVGLVFCGAQLRTGQLLFYRASMDSGEPVSWPAFLSASQKATVAHQYLHSPRKNCLFVIQSRTGRLIGEISKYGVDGQNESEVLFAPRTRFEVVAMVAETGYTRIVLDEL
ncbi:ADP-ribosyltransferase domain-containing protein [Hymenobacter ruricola]|uniref:NAD(+)--protein-arginine ADP-ribosyltransferase n=1 Tax=Hymenobacter ruricola TaxID=2791023 RepID=A0ABS0IAU0_9BACT|nr:ADP-ribosyltransferase domain-containing protein [Hymenobacter ruricola]MBF9224078.1 hypothetical protein [Hymenobacter ruricola]